MTLKDARIDRRLTQERLSELSGVDQTVISAIETGRTQSPSWDTVAKLSTALNVRPEELFPVAASEARS